MEAFKNEYLERKEPMHFRKCRITDTETGDGEFATLAKVVYTDHGIEKTFEGVGNGPIDAIQRGMEDAWASRLRFWTTVSTHWHPVPVQRLLPTSIW